MVEFDSSWVQTGPGNSASAIGQVGSQPLTWTNVPKVGVGGASEALLASASGVGRIVILKVPSTAANGVHVAFGAAATTDHFLLEPGESRAWATSGQAINAIRAGGAVDIDVYIQTGVST